jgi:hypothetical protein
MNPYDTHLVVLEKAINITSGDVLEIGCGNGSTNFLHNACKNRKLYTIETNREWFNKFIDFESDYHKLICKNNYDEFHDLIMGNKWDVVLVDHAPGERRNIDINKLHHVKYVVIHDTEEKGYNYHLSIPLYKYRFEYSKIIPATTIVSDIIDVGDFL